MVSCRAATEIDWCILKPFFSRVYRSRHPLHSFEFWRWQFMGQGQSGSFIVCDQNRVVGHLGAYFRAGYSWLMDIYIDEQYRNRGFLRELHGMARSVFPLAVTNVNRHALHHLRKLNFIRYCDLQRFVTINPAIKDTTRLCDSLTVKTDWDIAKGDYFWQQPFLKGVRLPGGSTAINQLNVGGLRLIELVDIEQDIMACWDAGVAWIDFVTSWNDPLCRVLEKSGWYFGDDCPVPWLLDPIVYRSKAQISFLSEKPMPHNFIVKRTYSDHGRIGSLPDSWNGTI